jgi:predicted HAD superfamily Cof-like phosphohydrolase
MMKAIRPGVNIFVLIYAKILLNTMKKPLDQVKKFHKAFGLDVSETQLADLGLEKNLLRYKLMREENEEYLDAASQGDMIEIADALGDMLYILCGTIISHGMQHKIEEVFDEIHKSNMSKLGANGKPIYREDGKVLKGPDYFKPDLKRIIDES